MTEANIYQLSKLSWIKGLAKLLENIIAKGNKVLISCESEDFMSKLDDALWTYEQLSFLPHATCNDSQQEKQPILLSTSEINANNATVLILAERFIPKILNDFEKIVIIYEKNDSAYEEFVTQKAIPYFKIKKVTYTVFKQNDNGTWEKSSL